MISNTVPFVSMGDYVFKKIDGWVYEEWRCFNKEDECIAKFRIDIPYDRESPKVYFAIKTSENGRWEYYVPINNDDVRITTSFATYYVFKSNKIRIKLMNAFVKELDEHFKNDNTNSNLPTKNKK